eukprot:Seg1855.9 transcript_id=Seg1855.9/GoldUCD/mRNA.D3Y31 product="50S ribosomal protein L1" pseudo=true protein_id=Seg1855.9/GoldUCD/D3Y31
MVGYKIQFIYLNRIAPLLQVVNPGSHSTFHISFVLDRIFLTGAPVETHFQTETARIKAKMAANLRSCWKCMHNFAASKQLFSLQIKCFSSSSVLERLKNDYRIKPAPPKRKWEPPVIRQDVIFLYKGVAKRSFPYHKFDLAMEILRAIAVKDENVNLFIRLNLKGKDITTEDIKGNIIFPNQGKRKRILVLAEGQDAEEAKEAGADIVGGKEILADVEAEEYEFDYCLSSLEFLPNIQHLSKVLRYNMPSQAYGTATNNLAFAVREFKRAQRYKCTKSSFIALDIAKLSFTDDEIKENLQTTINAVASHTPQGVNKDTFVKKIYLKTCHGPGLLLHKRDFLF